MLILRLVFTLALCTGIPTAFAVTYTCKDKSGKWTEEACPDYEQRKIAEGQKIIEEQNRREWTPKIGMTSADVSAILKSPDCYKTRAYKWCGGWLVNSTKTARGTREQWVFRDARGMPLHYLYFDNGVLVTIQE